MDEARKVIKENELAKIKLAREMEKTREQENAAVREYQKIEEEKESVGLGCPSIVYWIPTVGRYFSHSPFWEV